MMKQLFMMLGLCLCVSAIYAQRNLTGTISDRETGEMLIGATVTVKGTATGVITDYNGAFRLTVPAGSNTLVFAYTGYETVEMELGASNTLDITMAPAASGLQEVVVVGYGTQIKSTLTGNIAKLGSDQIENLPVVSVEQALQGKAAGVFVETSNGKVGGAIRVRVRGASSISASSQPLYIIDGIPVTSEAQNTPGTAYNLSGAPLNPLADLNFNDVESIEILKDASAGAIYGSRAANGVVLITTKKGKAGKSKVDFNFQTGVSEPTNLREFINAEEYVSLFRRSAIGAAKWRFKNNPLPAWRTEEDAIRALTTQMENRFNSRAGHTDWRELETDTDWQSQAFAENPMSSQANLSASGGTEKTKYYASAAWSRQEGILTNNNFERMSARLNLDQAIAEKINFGLNMSLSRTFTDQVAGDNAFSSRLQLVALSPLSPLRDEEGLLYNTPVTSYYNGLIDIEDAQRNVLTFRSLSNGYLRWELLKGLMLNGEIGADIYTLRDNAFYGRRTNSGDDSDGFGSSQYSQVVNLTPKVFLNYDFSLSDRHNFGLTAGMEYQKSRFDQSSLDGERFPVDDLKTLQSAAQIVRGTSSITEYSFLSYLARANYNFDQKYLLSLSGRVDGSSRFGQNSRYGFFPAASAGWVLTEEGFLNNNSILSFLKVRGSFGLTGNAAIDNFKSLGLYGAEAYNGQSGLAPTQIPNPNLEWEKTAQTDVGIDFGLFNNRLNGEIDYYYKKTTDLLLDVPVPATSGFEVQTQNVGAVENKGFEFVLNSNNLVGAFKWNSSLNLAFNRNKVLKLAPGQDLIDNNILNVVKVGHPIGAFFGAEYAGVDPANGDALFYKNTPESGRETTNDFTEANFVILGSPVPTVIGGITNSFSWKGLSLDVVLQGVGGNEIYNLAGRYMSCQGCEIDNQTRDQLKYWDKPGDITDVPEPRFRVPNGDQERNSRYLSDGAYLRLRTLNLGFDLPKSVVSKAKLARAKVYFVGQNLLTFTNYNGWDPEVTSDDYLDNVVSGLDFYAAPQPKTYTFGINLGF